MCALNPAACGGRARVRWPQVAEIFGRLGVEYDLLDSTDETAGVQVYRRLGEVGVDGYGAIAGIGGDGTHSSIVNELMRFRTRHPQIELPPYAIIPLGTGNDIAKSFGLNARADFFVNDLRRACATTVHGADYRLDLGQVEDCYFVDAFTIGLDSHILQEHNLRKRKLRQVPLVRNLLRGNLLYTLCTGSRFMRQDPVEAEVAIDGERWYAGPMLNLIINNTRIYAGEFDFCTDGYSNDGMLDVVLFTGKVDYLSKYLLSMRGNPRKVREMAATLSSISMQKQGREIEIRLSRPEAAQRDGEEWPKGDAFSVAVVPSAIGIKTPAE